MGMSAFNRARRSRLDVEEAEARRYQDWHKAHWGAHHLTDKDPDKTDREVEKIRRLDAEASDLIGEKARQGILEGEQGGIIDRPLREDHAAEIAGRTQVDGQGEPTSPVERVRQRIADGSANEQLVSHTQVDQPGPPAELVREAQLEVEAPENRDAVARQLDAEAETARVEREAVQAEKDARAETAAARAEGDAARARGEVAPVQAAARARTEPSATEQADAEAARVAQQKVAQDAGGDGTDGDQEAQDAEAARLLEENRKIEELRAAEAAKLPDAGKSAGAGREASTSTAAASRAKRGTAKK